jgi:hypothetical protein
LNFFDVQPGPLDPDKLRIGQALADVATIGLIQQRVIHDRHVLTGQLQTAFNSRVLIEQAKGVLAERLGLDMADAFTLLRAATATATCPTSPTPSSTAPNRSPPHRSRPLRPARRRHRSGDSRADEGNGAPAMPHATQPTRPCTPGVVQRLDGVVRSRSRPPGRRLRSSALSVRRA